MIKHQKIFEGVEEFIFLTVNKALGNFALKDKIISRYSIYLINQIIVRLKSKLNRDIFNELQILRHISTELLKINDTSLADPTFYKLRSELYEVISICYLNDSYKDYIPNIHLVLNQILETNLKGDNIKVVAGDAVEHHQSAARPYRSRQAVGEEQGVRHLLQDRIPESSESDQRIWRPAD